MKKNTLQSIVKSIPAAEKDQILMALLVTEQDRECANRLRRKHSKSGKGLAALISTITGRNAK